MRIYSTKFLLVGAFLLLVAFCYTSYVYFTPSEKVAKTRTDASITASKMLSEFEADAAAADNQYKGKVLEVTGQIHKVSDEGAAPVLVFDAGGKYVITAGMHDPEIKVKAGEQVTVKGLYSGIIVNDMLPVNDIKIEQCSIVE